MEEPSVEELRTAFKSAYNDLIDFVTTSEFQAILDDLDSLRVDQKIKFVKDVLLRSDALEDRGVVVPKGILIQRSSFGDRRPTLFCVKKYLPKRFHCYWENANITFDAASDYDISRDPSLCWRRPINPAYQAKVMSRQCDLELVDDEHLVAAQYMGRTAGLF